MVNFRKITKLLYVCILLSAIIEATPLVTYLSKNKWGGRLGDMLLMYTKAKWVSYHYQLPLLYKPFEYSDQLEMHYRQPHFDDIKNSYLQEVICRNKALLAQLKDNSIYTIHYYFTLPNWGDYQEKYDGQEIMTWQEVYNDNDFLHELRKDITPHEDLILTELPGDKISVAVHIRMGKGFDAPLLSRQLYDVNHLVTDDKMPKKKNFADRAWPLKFPPTQYYIDQIKALSTLLNDAELYVYIFTDSPEPVRLMLNIERLVNKSNITFDCRRENNIHNHNVLEDMFSMARFDCLIRSGSNYPQVSQLIGDHKIVIYPKSAKWVGTTLVIDDVGMLVRDY